MASGDESEAVRALRVCVTELTELTERDRQAQRQLLAAREELARRDDTFAALEADLWEQFTDHERRSVATIAELEAELAEIRDRLAEREHELVRLQVRLERIASSPPAVLYATLKRLPGVRAIAAHRTRGYDAAVRRRLRP